MHPIFAGRGRLGLYLLAWLPLALLLVVLLAWREGLAWGEAALVGLPLAYVEAYVCLAAWYLCRRFPLRGAGGPTLPDLEALVVHGAAALVSSGVWVGAARVWLALLATIPGLAPLEARFDDFVPILLALGVPLSLLSVAFHYLLAAIIERGEVEARAASSRLRAREAEWRALRAELDPHFLFNSLNVVAALVRSDPAGARSMAILLAEFLRRCLAARGLEEIALADEIALARSYLAVERARFGDRLSIEEVVDTAALGRAVPPLLLQPLVENAVRHGVAQLLSGGAVRLEAAVDGERLRLAVENPCADEASRARGHGVGLGNVEARLAGRYGAAASLRIARGAGCFRVEIELPARDAVAAPALARAAEEAATSVG